MFPFYIFASYTCHLAQKFVYLHTDVTIFCFSFRHQQIIGSESIEETDIGTQISRFLEDYREGNVIQKRITGLSFIDFIGSQMGIRLVLMIIFVVAVMILILTIGKEEPPRVGRRDQVDHGGSSVSQKEAIELLRATDKED